MALTTTLSKQPAVIHTHCDWSYGQFWRGCTGCTGQEPVSIAPSFNSSHCSCHCLQPGEWDREAQNPRVVCVGTEHFLCHEQGQVAQRLQPDLRHSQVGESSIAHIPLLLGVIPGVCLSQSLHSSTSSPPPAALALRGGFPAPGEQCPLLLDGAGA